MTPPMATPPAGSRGARAWAVAWRLAAVVLIGALALLVSYGMLLESYGPEADPPARFFVLFLLDVALGVIATALYPVRHRAPLPVTGAIVALSALSTLAFGAAVFAVVSLATRRQRRELLAITPLFLLVAVVNEALLPVPEDPVAWWQLIAFQGFVLGMLLMTGMYIGGRRQLHAALEKEVASARRERAALLETARGSERTQIAREMHDVLAHRLSLVTLHSGVLESRTDLSPEQTRATAGVIRDSAHLALTELREVLGVLRTQPGDADGVAMTASRPQPNLTRLDELVRDSRTAGNLTTVQVDGSLSGQLANLPESTSRHLYRIIQEGLTNARKHAPGQPVRVRLGGQVGEVVCVRVSNPVDAAQARTAQPGAGFGLAGLQERVRLADGHLSAGHDGSGHFLVNAELPWTIS
ncbi:MAG: histidine kinase [Candidatus Nanopelagicales bacterium]